MKDDISKAYHEGYEQGRFDAIAGIPHGLEKGYSVMAVVHGEWRLLDECSNAGVYCSVCHKAVFRENAWYKNVHIKSKYCPNCGARMDGKHEKL